MPELSMVDRLEQAVGALLAGSGAEFSSVDARLEPLVRIAGDLRDLPRPGFKAQLKADLERKASMTPRAVRAIPEGFHTITPYLVVEGAAKLIDFMKQAFGATEKLRVPLPDGTIMHAEVGIGDSVVELGDASAEVPPRLASIHLYVSDADAVYRRAVEAGATSTEEPVDQPYGDREAGVRDACGNEWYIATHKAAGAGRFVPEGLRTVTPYLHPKGADQMIDFLKRAFDAQEVDRDESPAGVIMHAKIQIGDSIIEMGEAHGPWQPKPTGIHLYVNDTDAVYRNALAAGGTSLREPADQPYGDRAAGVEDPFGNSWWIATHIRDMPPPA